MFKNLVLSSRILPISLMYSLLLKMTPDPVPLPHKAEAESNIFLADALPRERKDPPTSAARTSYCVSGRYPWANTSFQRPPNPQNSRPVAACGVIGVTSLTTVCFFIFSSPREFNQIFSFLFLGFMCDCKSAMSHDC